MKKLNVEHLVIIYINAIVLAALFFMVIGWIVDPNFPGLGKLVVIIEIVCLPPHILFMVYIWKKSTEQ